MLRKTGKRTKKIHRKRLCFTQNFQNLSVIADDGGIEIDALDGAPELNQEDG